VLFIKLRLCFFAFLASWLLVLIGSFFLFFFVCLFVCLLAPSAAHVLLPLLFFSSCVQGPMWRQIRGMGLAYSYNLFLDVEAGLLYFTLAKSTNLPKAYQVAYDLCV
jgi:hypothetical protein